MYKNYSLENATINASSYGEAQSHQVGIDPIQPDFARELIFADGLCQQIAGILPEAAHEAIALQAGSDPVRAISEELNSRRAAGIPVETLHIVAHGRPGAVQIGGLWIDREALLNQASQIASWQVQKIALWSCGAGADATFIQQWADLTGAVVFATASSLDSRQTTLLPMTGSHGAARLDLRDVFTSAAVASMNFTLAEVSLMFSDGYLGTQGSSTNATNNIRLFSAAGISRVAFVQTDANGDGKFGDGGTQGNDLAGAIRIYKTDGTVVTLTGALNWRETTGSKVEVLGFIFDAGQNDAGLGITGGTTSGTSTNLGLKNFTSSFTFTTGESRNGNAAPAGLLDALNNALASSAQPSAISLAAPSVTEGTSLVYTVTLDKATPYSQDYLLSLTGGTATAGSDYNNTSYTLSNGVTKNADGSTISVPTGVSSFTVTVTTVDDSAVESSETVILTVGKASGTGTLLDNDALPAYGLTLSKTSLTTSEAGATDSFGVKLNAQPTSDVTVTLTGLDSTEGSLSATTLTFTPANWNVEQNVTVTGVDDPQVDGNIPYTLTATTSGDSNYSGANAKSQTIGVTNTDNDAAGLTLSKASLITSENGTTASFGIKLNTQPTSDVTVTLTGLDSTEGSLSATTLTFTPANWNVEQNVTVTGVDDPLTDGDIAYTLTATTGGDSAYAGTNAKSQTIGVTNTDNDAAGLTLSKASLITSENGTTASFGIKLNTQPTSDVTVTLTGLDSTEGSLSATTLTFTPANWNVEQNVTVTGVDDPLTDGDIAYTLTATTGGDSAYAGANAKSQTIGVTNTDNDAAGLTLSKASLITSENGTTASFGIKLNTQPTSDVTVTLTGLDSTEGSLSATTLTFTPANWNVEQNVTVTGVDDPLTDGDIAYTLTATTGGDSAYAGANAKSQTIGVTNTDNDAAGLTLSKASLITSENGTTASFGIKLNTQPTSDVTVTLTGLDSTEGSLSATTLTFTPANWNVEQNVTVTGVDDPVVDGDIAYTLTATTGGDSAYAGANAKSQTIGVTNTDNDSANLTVTGLPDVSEGSNAIFTVKLGAASTAPSEITLTLGASTDTAEKDDYSAAYTAYYYEGNVQKALSVTNGKLSLPAGVDRFYVKVPTTSDSVYEGTEDFTLAAALKGGNSGSATTTILDNGAGKQYDDKGQPVAGTPDDDRNGLSVTGGTYNEGSDAALFTVTAPQGEMVTLGLSDIDTTGINKEGLIRYSTDGGLTWKPYTGAFPAPLDGSPIKVAVALTPEKDSVYEGPEHFRLTATTGGKAAEATGTITDDGTGDLYKLDSAGKPVLNTTLPKDDDRPGITVTGQPDVSEGSKAVFTVALSNASTVPTEIALTLGAAGDTATSGVDYNPAFSAYYFDGANKVPLTLTGGKITLPANVTHFYVGVPTTDDTAFEGSEKLSLAAAITNGKSASGASNIVDDGSGKVYDDKGQPIAGTPNDDRSITVTGLPDVSEGSNAIFTVKLGAASTAPSEVALTLGAAKDTAEKDDYSAAYTAYYYKGAVQTPLTITDGKVSLPAGVDRFFVKTATTADGVYEGAENFTLAAALKGGNSGSATSTILDNGAGKQYDDKGQPVAGTPDDDRNGLGVTGGVYNEGSDAALFTVTAPQGEMVTLGLSDIDTTGINKDGLMRYSTDGGLTWKPYTGAFPAPLDGSPIKVAVAITPEKDSVYEGPEHFHLTATTGGKTAEATGTITDDGTGDLYKLDPAGKPVLDTTSPKDDDRPGITVTGLPKVSEGSKAVFSVALSNASAVPTEIALTLGAAGDTATSGVDYNPAFSAYYFDGANKVPLTLTGGKITLPANVTHFYVGVPTTSDTTFEGSEKLSLAAAITSGKSASGASNIVDDGSGKQYDDKGQPIAATPDDDRSIKVTGLPKVSEGSNAIFTVKLGAASSAPSEVALTLGSATDTAEKDDYSAAYTAYYYTGSTLKSLKGVAAQKALTVNDGKVSLPAGVTTFYVKVATTADSVYEGAEDFTLKAALRGGNSGQAVTTVLDDGTGKVYNDQGQPIAGTPDDDRAGLSVTGGVYNEASDVALFTVTAPQGQPVTLTLSDIDTSGLNNDDLIRYSTDGGVSWQSYTGPFTSPADGRILVAVDITGEQDDVYEGAEHFHLTANSGGKAAEATATIRDDGAGDLLQLNRMGNPLIDGKGNPLLDTSTPKDDDAPVISVSSPDDVSEGSKAVYTVALSNASASPTEITLSLGGKGDSATPGADYSPEMSVYYFDGTTKVPLNIVGGKVTLPAHVSNFYVGVPTVNDGVYEGRESLALAASLPDGESASGVTAIVDDGTGKIYDDKGRLVTGLADDDRAVDISGPRVNEASPYAVFTVDGAPGQEVSLSLADGTATAADYGNTLDVSSDGGTTWAPYTGGSVALSNADGSLLVRTPVKQDITYEGAETFTLTTTNQGGKQATGTATIVDDGSGTIFNPDGSENISAVKDDDRILKVENITVNEGSPYAVFRVSGVEGQQLSLSLEETGTDYAPLSGHAKLGTDTGTQLQYFDGNQWANYTPGSTVTYPQGSVTLLVRVAIKNDNVFEKQESFKLKASAGDLTSYGTGIISDDGQGPIYNESGAIDPNAVRDDDRSLKINSIEVNEGSGYAVFTVSAASASQVELALVKTGVGVDYATLGVDTGTQLQYLDGGKWKDYAAGSKVPVAGGQLFVRVAIINDTDKESPESFRLLARDDVQGTAYGTATIQNNGTGELWLANNERPATQAQLAAAKVVLDDDFDLDGISPHVEEILATMSSSTGNGGKDGDLNSDGKQDAEQSALATLAWIKATNFQKALAGTLTEVKPIVSLAVASAVTPTGDVQVGDSQYQLSNIQVVSQNAGVVGGKLVNNTITEEGTKIDAPWDPLQFTVTPKGDAKKLVDIDPARAGTQILTDIDVSRAGLKEGDFNGYLKYVSQSAIDAANAKGITLQTLDGTPITKADWYDFTQHQDANGNYIGDGAHYVIQDGAITGIEITLTDNAFGDDNMALNQILDPGMPVLLTPNVAPVVDLASDDATTLNRSVTFVGGHDAVAFGESGKTNISDVDNANLNRLSVSIDKNTVESGDELVIGSTTIDLTQASANGTVNAGATLFSYVLADSGNTRTLTFTSRDAANTADTPASKADFDTLLDTLSFKSSSDSFTDNGLRTFNVVAADSYDSSESAVLTINMDAIKWIYSSKDVTLPDGVDNVQLNNPAGTWDLSCLPDWLRSSVKVNGGGSAKNVNLNATGNAMDNQMIGNVGKNTLSGLGGNDGLYGFDGNDVLIGGAGADTLSGGNGKDVFSYLSLDDSGVGAGNRDVITDFTVQDKLDLGKLDANSTKTGDQSFRYIANEAFGKVPGQLRFDGDVLQADTNGDGVADFEVELVGLTNLSVHNIVL